MSRDEWVIESAPICRPVVIAYKGGRERTRAYLDMMAAHEVLRAIAMRASSRGEARGRGGRTLRNT